MTAHILLRPIASSLEVISIKEAAKRAGRSTSWVRNKLMFGPLIPAERDGRRSVEAASLVRLLAERRSSGRVNRGTPYPHLRLVHSRP